MNVVVYPYSDLFFPNASFSTLFLAIVAWNSFK